jgi:hypothetical protein
MGIPLLVTPIGTGSGTSTASTESIASTASTASTSTQNAINNEASGLNSLLNLASQGAQVAGAIKYQRQQSGASARRQSLIAQCGRAPLIGRQRKEEYRKCKADYEASLLRTQTQNLDENKNLLNDESGSSMKFVWIGLGVIALGGIAYLALKKK